jgi:hypothetical protein
LTKQTEKAHSVRNTAADAAVHRKMREQSLRVPWRELADACERLVEWRSYALWVRAIINAEQGLPEWLREHLDQRCPGFLESRPRRANPDTIWLDLSGWVDDHFFRAARDGGWLDALHYYSGRCPRSERVWEHWTREDSAWANSRPLAYPSFEEWQEALKNYPPPDEEQARRTLLPDDRFAALIEEYIEWEAFAFWVRAVVESAGEVPAELADVLRQRCPGFLDRVRGEKGPRGTEYTTWLWRELLAWIEASFFGEPRAASCLDKLRDAARTHLRGERIAAWWADCSSRWRRKPPASYPSFDEWLQMADTFVTQ